MTDPADDHSRRLVEARRRIELEIEALRNQIRGLETAYAALGGANAHRAPRGNVKALLIDLLSEAGPHGLNAQLAVAMAARTGFFLDRNTASSLLSRLKRYGIVEHDGERYRLKERFQAPAILEAA